MGEASQPRLVKALYNFKPSNTDELAFSKGDVITLTQTEEGGWWEGTLRDKTGWFPSNYVKDIKEGRTISPNPTESTAFYHNVVLESLIETERRMVQDLHTLLQDYLRPLSKANVISATEYGALLGNLEEIAAVHHKLLSALDDCAKKPLQQQRIGGVFIKQAPELQNLYKSYCSNHPKAVQVLQKCKDELGAFMEKAGAPAPGIIWLTTSLSLPFSRLEKYPTLLKEVERHTEKAHVDRGNTQRAISVYRDIAASCADIRKQKELEYELMSTPIKGWEGENMASLREVLLMSHVLLHVDSGEKRERLFVLFHGVLVMLSAGSHLSAYTYEGKLATGGMSVTPIEETENSNYSNAFEITGSMIDRRVVSCVSRAEQSQWVEALRKQSKVSAHAPQKARLHHMQVAASMPSVQKVKSQVLMRPVAKRHNSVWSMSCLRPCPPLRPTIREEDGRTNRGFLTYRKKPVEDRKTSEEDSVILQVIEAYCTSAKARHTVNSSLLDSPQMLIAEDEKIIVEDLKGGQVVIEEKSLVDTVYELRDQVKELKQEQERMKREMEEGRKANSRLETLVRKTLKTASASESRSSVYMVDNVEGAESQTV